MNTYQLNDIKQQNLSSLQFNELGFTPFQFIQSILPRLNQFYDKKVSPTNQVQHSKTLPAKDFNIQKNEQIHQFKERNSIRSLGNVEESIMNLLYSIYQMSFMLETQSAKLDFKLTASQLAKKFQTLRLEVQIYNMENSFQPNSHIDYQQLIQHFFKQIFHFSRLKPIYQILMLTIKQSYANISEELIFKIYAMKTSISEINVNKIVQNNISQKNLALKYIKLRQKQLNQNENIQKNIIETFSSNQNTFKDSIRFKSKYIQKTRTIYHERKNIYTSKIKKNERFYQKDKFEVSTQKSFNSSNSKKIRRPMHIFQDEELEENALAGKTPVQNKIFFDKSISLRLEF